MTLSRLATLVAAEPTIQQALQDRADGLSTLNVQAGQGLRLQLINPATVRFFRLRLTTSTGALVPLVRIGGQGGLHVSFRRSPLAAHSTFAVAIV